jgi:hypothetical protein
MSGTADSAAPVIIAADVTGGALAHDASQHVTDAQAIDRHEFDLMSWIDGDVGADLYGPSGVMSR